MTEIDYEKIGLKVGLEIHQQLDTRKLFCNCPSKLVEDDEVKFFRELRAAKSETGEVDVAAIAEEEKGRIYKYIAPKECSCLVEADEEPPHEVNKEALEIAIEISLLLNAKLIDEVYFMRKIVIDGSNTSGYQRTALIAVDGKVKGIGIKTICLEEEAARKVREEDGAVVYNLDRLGIPLVEIATEPEIHDPEKAKEVAEEIGMILRSTKRVKRGLGTIRQDLNISIRGGARIEIKGVQELDLIPEIVKKEAERQLFLLKLREELNSRINPYNLKFEVFDVTDAFRECKSKFVRKALSKGAKVLGIKLERLKGLIGKGGDYRLGRELASRVKVKTGLKGILHSDELPGYGISEEEVKKAREIMGAGEEDAFVLVIAEEELGKRALRVAFERVLEAFKGVPEEVRRALPDGSTEYMRPLPGSARMYPETDIPPIKIEEEIIEKIRQSLPETFEEKVRRYVREYGIGEEEAWTILRRGHDEIFEYACSLGIPPTIAVKTLLGTLREVRREVGDLRNVDEEVLRDVFLELSKGTYSKEAIPQILEYIAKNGKMRAKEVAEKLGLTSISEEEAREIIRKTVEEMMDTVRERGMKAMGPIMGRVMEKLRGRIDGKVVSKIVKEELDKVIGGRK